MYRMTYVHFLKTHVEKNRARPLYKHISMLFLFPVKDCIMLRLVFNNLKLRYKTIA